MKKENINTLFLFILIALVGVVVYFIFKPFLVPIFLAFVLAQLFKGWFGKIKKIFKGHDSLASLVTCLILFFILVIPFFITLTLIAKETTTLYKQVQQTNWEEYAITVSELPIVENLGLNLDQTSLEGFALENSQELTKGTQDVGNMLFFVLKKIYEGTSNFLFMTFVMFFSLYYFLKDNKRIINKFMQLSPLRNKEESRLLKNFVSISKATLKGTLVIAIIQGFLLAVVFWITGVASPVLWGVVTALISIIPLLGAVLVWLPAGIIMLALGNFWQALVIVIFGVLVISSVDNVLRPKLVGNESSLHPILVFFSTIGGLALFGITGFIIGPAIVVLLISLLDIYKNEFKKELEEMNA